MVWGWLAAWIAIDPPSLTRKNLKALIALATGTISLGGALAALLGWRLALVFAAGAIFAWLVHRAWHNSLQKKSIIFDHQRR